MSGDAAFQHLSQGLRRVTTGVDADGKAVVMRDERITGDPRGFLVWGADAPPIAGDDAMPPMAQWWPPAGGVRVSLSTRAPESGADPVKPRPKVWPDINDAAGFHASRSVDVIVMIEGRIWLELDDSTVELNAGDILIQNGTRHRWRNHGDSWPLMAVVIVGAHPRNEAAHHD
jgi:mannose-6-phosphate isomerase-like protein (cupin superfamily)